MPARIMWPRTKPAVTGASGALPAGTYRLTVTAQESGTFHSGCCYDPYNVYEYTLLFIEDGPGGCVPDGHAVAGEPLRVGKDGSGGLLLTWGTNGAAVGPIRAKQIAAGAPKPEVSHRDDQGNISGPCRMPPPVR